MWFSWMPNREKPYANLTNPYLPMSLTKAVFLKQVEMGKCCTHTNLCKVVTTGVCTATWTSTGTAWYKSRNEVYRCHWKPAVHDRGNLAMAGTLILPPQPHQQPLWTRIPWLPGYRRIQPSRGQLPITTQTWPLNLPACSPSLTELDTRSVAYCDVQAPRGAPARHSAQNGRRSSRCNGK